MMRNDLCTGKICTLGGEDDRTVVDLAGVETCDAKLVTVPATLQCPLPIGEKWEPKI